MSDPAATAAAVPPRAAPRYRQPIVHNTGMPHHSFDFETAMTTQPEKFKKFIEKVSNNKKLPACRILKDVLMNNAPTDIIEECDLVYDSLKKTPILTSRSKQPKVFTSYPCLDISTEQNEESDLSEIKEKHAAAFIFLQLFQSCNLHDEDYNKMKDFTNGESSYDRTVIWLCQMAEFLETGKVPIFGEISVFEEVSH